MTRGRETLLVTSTVMLCASPLLAQGAFCIATSASLTPNGWVAPSAAAAEAGVETAARFRGRGLAPQVTAAWALAIRASNRLPLYSTSWSNEPSLAVARKLGLKPCASDWSLSD